MASIGESATHDPAAYGLGRLFWLSSEAVVGADIRTEVVTLWNPAASRLFGYGEDEAIGMRLDRLVPTELGAAHHHGLDRYRNGGLPVLVGGDPVEVPAVTKDGRTIHVALTLTAVPEQELGRFVVAIIRDVTAQREAETGLRAANEAMRTFVAAASHDLRTPMSTVLGYAGLLEERGADLDEGQRVEFAGAIRRAGEQAVRLVEDLLMLSRIDAGALDPRPETVPLSPALARAVEACRSGAAVTCTADEVAWVDPDHLHRMVVNLLSNAERYGAPPVAVSVVAADGSVEIRVSDSGAGVPSDFVGRLFTPFARVHAASPIGTGLGLSIVKGLAEANVGGVFYEPGATGGCCFGLRLSAAPADGVTGPGR